MDHSRLGGWWMALLLIALVASDGYANVWSFVKKDDVRGLSSIHE